MATSSFKKNELGLQQPCLPFNYPPSLGCNVPTGTYGGGGGLRAPNPLQPPGSGEEKQGEMKRRRKRRKRRRKKTSRAVAMGVGWVRGMGVEYEGTGGRVSPTFRSEGDIISDVPLPLFSL